MNELQSYFYQQLRSYIVQITLYHQTENQLLNPFRSTSELINVLLPALGLPANATNPLLIAGPPV